jgi:Zn-dependent protease
LGTILVPGLLLAMGGFIFGWAKPVPVTWENLRNPRRDMALVAAAGPAANLVMAVLWGIIAKIGTEIPEGVQWAGQPMVYMGEFGIIINAVLMVLNLLPLPPLDGGRVAVGLLPPRLGWALSRVEPYGFFVLIALLATGTLSLIISPLVRWVGNAVWTLVGL